MARDEEERSRALELVRAGQSHGEVAEVLDIPRRTVSAWAQSAGIEPGQDRKQRVAALQAAALDMWQEKRAEAAALASQLATEALEAARRAVADGDGQNAQRFAITGGTAGDKAHAWTGGATSRSESIVVHTTPGELAQLRADLS